MISPICSFSEINEISDLSGSNISVLSAVQTPQWFRSPLPRAIDGSSVPLVGYEIKRTSANHIFDGIKGARRSELLYAVQSTINNQAELRNSAYIMIYRKPCVLPIIKSYFCTCGVGIRYSFILRIPTDLLFPYQITATGYSFQAKFY
jgi:hypothetical protein